MQTYVQTVVQTDVVLIIFQDVPEPLAVAKGQLYNLAREKLYELGRLAGHLTDDDTVLSDVDIEQLIEGELLAYSMIIIYLLYTNYTIILLLLFVDHF